jgi:hypothetical protein
MAPPPPAAVEEVPTPPLPPVAGFELLPPTAAEPELVDGLLVLVEVPPEPACAAAAPLPPLAAGDPVPALD